MRDAVHRLTRKPQYCALLLLGILILVAGCAGKTSGKRAPIAEKGVLDLRQWDFVQDGSVQLRGNWKIFWRQLLEPGEIAESDQKKDIFFNVPGYWNGKEIAGQVQDGNGYATFRVKLLLSPGANDFALRVPEQSSAFKLFLNGQQIVMNGKVGDSAATSRAQFLPLYKSIAAFPENDIILQISNFQNFSGGFSGLIELGTAQQVSAIQYRSQAIEFLIFGAILIMGMYHLILYMFRTREKAPFYFGVFCLLVAMRLLVVGEYILNRSFPELTHEFSRRIELFCFYAAVPVFTLFAQDLFRKYFPKYFVLAVLVFASVFSLIVLIFPLPVFTGTLRAYQLFTLFAGTFGGLVIPIKALKNHNPDARTFLIGWIPFFIFVAHDIVRDVYLLNTPPMASLGLCVFIFAQSAMLARRFTKARHIIENLSTELKERNQDLQNLNHLKDEFLSNISHEMKTPMTSILMSVEFLSDTTSTGELKNMALNAIRTGSEQMNGLVNRMLLSSELKSGSVASNPTDVDVRIAFERAAARTLEKHPEFRFRFDGPPLVLRSDEKLLEAMLSEILVNAAIHGGGSCDAHLRVIDHEAEIEITDSGPGVPAEFLPRLGQKFQRVDSSVTYAKAGTGLGLFLCAKIAEILGGSVQFGKAPQRGFTVIIRLPLEGAEKEGETYEKNSSRG